jgi:hypothetical protein
MYGVVAVPAVAAACTEDVTSAYGVFARVDNLSTAAGASIITNSYGIYIATATATGTVTNNYGLVIADLTTGTNKYALTTYGGAVTFNSSNAAEADFTVKTDTYSAIVVDTSNDSVQVMSNSSGKIGFWGATPAAKGLIITTGTTNVTFTDPGGSADYAWAGGTNSSARPNLKRWQKYCEIARIASTTWPEDYQIWV